MAGEELVVLLVFAIELEVVEVLGVIIGIRLRLGRVGSCPCRVICVDAKGERVSHSLAGGVEVVPCDGDFVRVLGEMTLLEVGLVHATGLKGVHRD